MAQTEFIMQSYFYNCTYSLPVITLFTYNLNPMLINFELIQLNSTCLASLSLLLWFAHSSSKGAFCWFFINTSVSLL